MAAMFWLYIGHEAALASSCSSFGDLRGRHRRAGPGSVAYRRADRGPAGQVPCVESMASVSARNIAAAISGEPPGSHEEFGEVAAVGMMDAGINGVLILAGRMLPLRKCGVMIPAPRSVP